MMDLYEYSEVASSQKLQEMNAMACMNSVANRDAVPSPVCYDFSFISMLSVIQTIRILFYSKDTRIQTWTINVPYLTQIQN